MKDIPRWARERRDNTKFKRKAAFFELLKTQVINMSIERDQTRVIFRTGIGQIKEILNTPEDVLFTDLKKHYLSPIFSDVSNATELNISIVEECRKGRKVDGIAIEVFSENRGCVDIINEISAFLKN